MRDAVPLSRWFSAQPRPQRQPTTTPRSRFDRRRDRRALEALADRLGRTTTTTRLLGPGYAGSTMRRRDADDRITQVLVVVRIRPVLLLFFAERICSACASHARTPTRSGLHRHERILRHAHRGEPDRARPGAAALSRPATVSEPAQPAPTRDEPRDRPARRRDRGGAPVPHSAHAGGARTSSGVTRAGRRRFRPPSASRMIIGAFVVLAKFMLASVRTTTAMRQRVRDSTLEQATNADGSAEKVPVFGSRLHRIRSKERCEIRAGTTFPSPGGSLPERERPGGERAAGASSPTPSPTKPPSRIQVERATSTRRGEARSWTSARSSTTARATSSARRSGTWTRGSSPSRATRPSSAMWRLEHGGFHRKSRPPDYVTPMTGPTDAARRCAPRTGDGRTACACPTITSGTRSTRWTRPWRASRRSSRRFATLAPKARVVVLAANARGEACKGWRHRSYLQPAGHRVIDASLAGWRSTWRPWRR